MNRALSLVMAVGVLLLLGVFISCVYTVSQTQQVLLVQFGAPVGIVSDPGLHFKSPLQRAYFFDRRLLNLDAQSEEVITLDRKRIVVDAYARWRIADPLLFNQAQPEFDRAVDSLKAILSSNIREVLGSENFTAMLSGKRSQLMRQIRDRMNADTKQWGITVVDVRIRRADLPGENSDAIYQRMNKERERQATQYRAEGDAVAQLIKARADREAIVIKAEAMSQAAIIRGEGDAQKTKITAAAFNQDPSFYAFWRSMQAYQDSMQGSNTTLIISPKSDFLKYFGEGPGAAGKRK
ncbi:membrane protease subunit HflC [Rhizomicrobium palustre]|uniref:Protein HflC n=1 Tax=Rhizomicrobium palustre TaxID=189966 RepID=A0A846MWQ1_9PROT|nr:protease modulator HflC [Rhizomicrobium palustre]NIK87460.1 membrane protease subunit HflC [Rhizomicrobium palustre]